MHYRTIFLTCFVVAKILLILIFLLPTSGKKPVFAGEMAKTVFAGAFFNQGKNVFFPSSGENLPTLNSK